MTGVEFMRVLKVVFYRKNLVLFFFFLLKIFGIVCGKRCNCVILVNVLVICWVLFGDGIICIGLICDGCGVI